MDQTVEINREFLRRFILRRENRSHKGDYGHALLVCGCDAMPGAASLATGAALKSGCGLVTLHSSAFACQAATIANPSAILSIGTGPCLSYHSFDMSKYTAVGIGPGLGRAPKTADAVMDILSSAGKNGTGAVIDADALNIIAGSKSGRSLLPPGSILTPHDGELARLISWTDDEDKILRTQELADSTGSIIVSKGFRTKLFVPGGSSYLTNTTGNPGMAKGGSGDVLTGLLTGLLARGYEALDAAALGIWIHGYAGDCCSEAFGMEAYDSKDLVGFLYKGFKDLYNL